MKKQQIQKEWEKLSIEITKNKPNIDDVYPSHITKRREILLLAQAVLEKIEVGEKVEFHTELYRIFMRYYFRQKMLDWKKPFITYLP